MGFVYILTNPSFEEWVKIGMTEKNDVSERVQELNNSSAVPFSFHIYATLETDEPRKLEGIIHNLLDTINPNLHAKEITEKGTPRIREFFHISAGTAYSIFQSIAEASKISAGLKKHGITEDEIKEEAEQDIIQSPRTPTTFKMLNIPAGTKLVYTLNDSIFCTTVNDDNLVEYNGQNMTLYKLVNEYLEPNSKYNINGFRRFKLENSNETLREMRKSLNEEYFS